MAALFDYQEDVSPTEHVLTVVEHLYTPTNHYGMGDFNCTFGDGGKTIKIDLMSGSEFPDDFDFSSLVGKRVKVGCSHAYHYIANDTQILEK